MAMQSITDASGNVIDEYDDEAGAEQSAPGQPETQQSSSSTTSSEVDAPQQEADGGHHPQTPVPSVPVAIQKEDATDFDASDVLIQIMLQRADGDPQGRLVSVVIHNFSGQPIIQDYREAELTDKARLDSIHRAIYPVMQRFLLELSARRQKKLEEEAKRAPRPTPQPRSPQVVPVTSPTSVPPTASASKPAPQRASGTTESEKKKEKQKKYQQIPLF